MTRDFVDDVNDNLQAFIVRLADLVPDGAVRQFGPIRAATCGVEYPVYNRILAFEPPPREKLAAAVAWLDERDLPFFVTMTETVADAVDDVVADLGLELADEDPGMVLASLDEIPPRETAAEFSEVTDTDELKDFITAATAVFDIPGDVGRQLTPDAILDVETIRLFIGRVDGQAVATGRFVQTDDVCGVYAISVNEGFRRQGIGEAMTWEILRAGRETGCQVGVLQSSEMAYSLYQRMGFETVVTYQHFEPAS